jgi:hypothetical protein
VPRPGAVGEHGGRVEHVEREVVDGDDAGRHQDRGPAAPSGGVHHLALNVLYPAAVFPNGAEYLRVVLHALVLVTEVASSAEERALASWRAASTRAAASVTRTKA